MIEKTVCGHCGSDSAPEGSRFCPQCGHGLPRPGDDETEHHVPMAAATPVPSQHDDVNNDDTNNPLSSSTVTYDEDITVTHNDNNGAMAAAATTSHGANFYLNPTTEMLARAKRCQTLGGILSQSTTGGGNINSKFVAARNIQSGSILGGVTIDFSYADFVHPVTTITAGTVLGGLKVIVPRGVQVETSHGWGILGSFHGPGQSSSSKKNRNNSSSSNDYTNGAASEHDTPLPDNSSCPLVVVRGLSILGAIEVKRNNKVPPVRIVK